MIHPSIDSAWPWWKRHLFAAALACNNNHQIYAYKVTRLIIMVIKTFFYQAKKKIRMCVYGHMSKKSRVGRSGFFFFFLLSAKPEIVVPGSGIRYFIFEISGKPSFVEAVLWRVMQFFYILCSQFRQKASGWINKTVLLIKQQNGYPNSV